ncbi:pyrroloquinoline quinone (PQQ) biosynthesis protein C [Actinocorallia herbida]|uniref:Pyrroloquinoline quinone (PQQ) biosynthesis protein C n=1 Tax=Actinocorallia herbida TaxID=58109 RepID=A0A3N1CYX0_9ACTN|nr:iron-containing redox enzyme family protein [Actinocorallia herbida]ROO86426.1 pyrroloquinoline quinone (PQQ) biosynthesis protein C [Actinocorallia herbida]
MAGAYDSALAEVAPVLKNLVVEHPFIDTIVNGELTRPVYAAYLRETYFLVGQTPYFLSAAAAHAKEEWLQDWFLDLAIDERHHDRLCVRDLRHLDYDPDAYLSGLPGLGAWTMIGQNHYLARMSDPAAIVGFAAATEGLGASLGPQAAAAMGQYEFAQTANSFLRVHAAEDQEHIETVKKAFEQCAQSPERYRLMTTTWEYTLRAYAQLFTDALEGATRGAP